MSRNQNLTLKVKMMLLLMRLPSCGVSLQILESLTMSLWAEKKTPVMVKKSQDGPILLDGQIPEKTTTKWSSKPMPNWDLRNPDTKPQQIMELEMSLLSTSSNSETTSMISRKKKKKKKMLWQRHNKRLLKLPQLVLLIECTTILSREMLPCCETWETQYDI